MSHFGDDWSSRAGSAGPSMNGASGSGSGSRAFLSRLESLGPSEVYESAIGDSVMSVDGTDGDEAMTVIEEEEGVFHPSLLGPSPEESELDDIRRLQRVWVRERGTPAILAWDGDLLDSLLDKLEQQGKMIGTLRMDAETTEDEHFRIVLVQTEMERAKYLVRSYVRTRLFKIEKYAPHIVDSPDLHLLLSDAELSHARKYADLVSTHFRHSVLDSLPEWLRKMDDVNNDGVSMVSTPNLATPVLIYCRKDCGELPLERGEVAVLAEGTTHLVRYDLVERWISLGWAEVL